MNNAVFSFVYLSLICGERPFNRVDEAPKELVCLVAEKFTEKIMRSLEHEMDISVFFLKTHLASNVSGV